MVSTDIVYILQNKALTRWFHTLEKPKMHLLHLKSSGVKTEGSYFDDDDEGNTYKS